MSEKMRILHNVKIWQSYRATVPLILPELEPHISCSSSWGERQTKEFFLLLMKTMVAEGIRCSENQPRNSRIYVPSAPISFPQLPSASLTIYQVHSAPSNSQKLHSALFISHQLLNLKEFGEYWNNLGKIVGSIMFQTRNKYGNIKYQYWMSDSCGSWKSL
jgi:hypothetical protein